MARSNDLAYYPGAEVMRALERETPQDRVLILRFLESVDQAEAKQTMADTDVLPN